MNKTEIRKKLEQRIENIRKEHDRLKAKILSDIEKTSIQGVKIDLELELERLELNFTSAVNSLENELDEVVKDEKIELEKMENNRKIAENDVKRRALQQWLNAGGDPSQFESAWGNIRETILTEQVVANLTANKTNSRFTL